MGCHLKWESIPWPGWRVKLAAKTTMKMCSFLLVAISVRLRFGNCVRMSRRHITAAGKAELSARQETSHDANQTKSLVSVQTSSFRFPATAHRTYERLSQILDLRGRSRDVNLPRWILLFVFFYPPFPLSYNRLRMCIYQTTSCVGFFQWQFLCHKLFFFFFLPVLPHCVLQFVDHSEQVDEAQMFNSIVFFVRY